MAAPGGQQDSDQYKHEEQPIRIEIDLEKLAELIVEKLRFELIVENERFGKG